ncbi:MAG TPA: MarR family transcriptional regulator [Desulfosporosinus sp.]
MGSGEKIYQAMQKFQKLGVTSKFAGELPRSEIMMLKMINLDTSQNEGVTISTLSERLEISKSAVSQMINVLEDKGYVERITTKNDRRIVYVRLTESGEQSLEKSLQSLLKHLNQVFDKMGEEDTETLLELLNKLYIIVSDYKKP